jgi:hypothetical protein
MRYINPQIGFLVLFMVAGYVLASENLERHLENAGGREKKCKF